MGIACRLQTAGEFGLDERRILQQAHDFRPYEALQQIQPDGALITLGLPS